ncbi:MAG: lysophospholipase [Alphaproteobacteria bacterium]
MVIAVALAAACAPRVQELGPAAFKGGVKPRITESGFITPDGRTLGLTVWKAPEPRAIIVALHGMNDYARAFALPAAWWAEHAGITTYAYDQRGFGRSPGRGIWPGHELLKADLDLFIQLVRIRHPGLPVYVLGDSMGGAVAIATAAQYRPEVEGMILVAPALWGWSTLPFGHRALLWLSAHLFPGMEVTGSGLDILPSDNIEELRRMSKDPLVIKGTRTDAVYGIVELMEHAYKSVPEVGLPGLLAYGEKDQIIPKKPVQHAITRFCAPLKVAIYPDGYHLLLRDLQAETVWRDVAAWIGNGGDGGLPSGAEKPKKAKAAVCAKRDGS